MSLRLAAAYGLVRERVGLVLSAVSEAVVGAPIVKAFGVGERTGRRINEAIGLHRDAAVRAQRLAALTFSGGELVAGPGQRRGDRGGGAGSVSAGHLSAGRLVAFLFLVTLFVGPVQVATETLNDAQNALAGLRRVLDVLDTPIDIPDPAERSQRRSRSCPPGPISVRFDGRRLLLSRRPAGADRHQSDGRRPRPDRRRRRDRQRQDDAGQAADPARRPGRGSGAAVRRPAYRGQLRVAALAGRDGAAGRSSVREHDRRQRPVRPAGGLRRADSAGFRRARPRRLAPRACRRASHTPVGQRGESLSAGERQLVAVVRAHIADPDVLVLDEATSAIDPATEMRLTRALESLALGRTTITIAHRLKAAEIADEVIVVDAGRIVARGRHADLVGVPGVYARLHASWSRAAR